MTAVVAADFGSDAPRGGALVDAARREGATWVVAELGNHAGSVRGVVRAVADAGLGLVVRVSDTRAYSGLYDAFRPAYAELSVAALRDRVVFVVATERAGKRLRADVPWAPSAADLGAIGAGLTGFLRKIAPNYVRAMCLADDVVAPHDLFDARRTDELAAKLRTRGGRLWLDRVPPRAVAGPASSPAHGIIVRHG